MTNKKLTQLLNLAIPTALNAGREIMKIYQTGDFNVEMKSDNSPLTKADKASHNLIVEKLKNISNQPINQSANQTSQRLDDCMIDEIPILSEEGKDIPYSERKNWNLYWLIDPLDGTKEFIKKNGEFTVNIALIENNKPILGVIYAPDFNQPITQSTNLYPERLNDWMIDCMNNVVEFQGALYFAASNLGAYKIFYDEEKNNYEQSTNQPINQSQHQTENGRDSNLKSNTKLITQKLPLLNAERWTLEAEKTAVGSRSHSSPEEKQKLEELGVTKTISVGSSLKFCMVAEGQADIYYRLGPTMEWDVAAGYAIAKESGAQIEGLKFNKENLLNSSFLVMRDRMIA